MRLSCSLLTWVGFATVFALSPETGLENRSLGKRFSGTMMTPRASGNTSQLDLAYAYMTVTVQVGKPPQNQTLTFDTGSPFFWVYYGDTNGLYDISASSSFTNQTTNFDAGVGNAYGYWANETINVGGFDFEGATIGMVNGTGHGQGGAMGFSPPSANDPAFGTWTSQMSTVLESPVAGLNIYQNQPGPITFGYLDTTQYVGDLTWVDIDTTTGSAWVASTVYYYINGTLTSASAGQPALMDTGGTTIMSLDEGIVKAYYSKVPSAKDVSDAGDASSWTVDCDAAMPDLQLAFGSHDEPSAIVLGSRLVNFGDTSSGTCQGYLSAKPAPDTQVLSRSFFLSNYVAMDFTQGATKVGLAQKATYEVIQTPEGGSAGPHNATHPTATRSSTSASSTATSSTSPLVSSPPPTSSPATSSAPTPSPTKNAGAKSAEAGGSVQCVMAALVGVLAMPMGTLII